MKRLFSFLFVLLIASHSVALVSDHEVVKDYRSFKTIKNALGFTKRNHIDNLIAMDKAIARELSNEGVKFYANLEQHGEV